MPKYQGFFSRLLMAQNTSWWMSQPQDKVLWKLGTEYYPSINSSHCSLWPARLRGSSAQTVLQVGCNGWFPANFHPDSCGRHFYWIAALARTAWDWNLLYIDMDFVTMLDAVEREGKKACTWTKELIFKEFILVDYDDILYDASKRSKQEKGRQGKDVIETLSQHSNKIKEINVDL